MSRWEIRQGDVLERLWEMPDSSVDCVITSPPYWGLRDYGVEGQLGLEPTPEAFITSMVGVFAEVRRVLKPSGTLWLNMGDSYAGARQASGTTDSRRRDDAEIPRSDRRIEVLKCKDLVGMPWRLAFALQAEGWYLRQNIVWDKTNPMPEAVKDRPATSHEFVFLLSKSPRYFYDAEAVREPVTGGAHARGSGVNPKANQSAGRSKQNASFSGAVSKLVSTRNLRSVWRIPTQPFRGAHFATFPEALVLPCVLAGTSEYGVCTTCGAPWQRIVEKGEPDTDHQRACGADSSGGYSGRATKDYGAARAQDASAVKARILAGMAHRSTVGWEPSCECGTSIRPAVVMDIFAGSGTVGVVAQKHGRDFLGIELNPKYVEMARRRVMAAVPGPSLFSGVVNG